MAVVHFFAGARAVMHAASLELPGGWSLEQADVVLVDHASTLTNSNELVRTHAASVLQRCTFLINGRAVSDRSHVVSADDRVDVLPPFAGG